MHEVIKQTGNTQVKQTKVNKGYKKKVYIKNLQIMNSE